MEVSVYIFGSLRVCDGSIFLRFSWFIICELIVYLFLLVWLCCALQVSIFPLKVYLCHVGMKDSSALADSTCSTRITQSHQQYLQVKLKQSIIGTHTQQHASQITWIQFPQVIRFSLRLFPRKQIGQGMMMIVTSKAGVYRRYTGGHSGSR